MSCVPTPAPDAAPLERMPLLAKVRFADDYGSLSTPTAPLRRPPALRQHSAPATLSASADTFESARWQHSPSVRCWPEPPIGCDAPWHSRILAARPEATLDTQWEAGRKACAQRTHALIATPWMRQRPALVLALFASSSAAVGGATCTYQGGRMLRDAVVQDGLRRGPVLWAERVHGPTAVPGALACDAVALCMTLTCAALACLTGAVSGVLAPLAAAPLLLAMPEHMRASLSDGLCNYLELHRRLDQLEALLTPSAWQGWHWGRRKRGAQAVEPAVHDGEQSIKQRLDWAYQNLQEHVSSLTHQGPRTEPLPPKQAHFQFVADLFAAHPKAVNTIGVPKPPRPERLLPLGERLRGAVMRKTRAKTTGVI